jgi:protein-tyrosine phosphatase
MSTEPGGGLQQMLFVCKGNICRSAAAEAVMTALANGAIGVRSRGTRGWHEGKPANEMMRNIALERGYDMETHVAHQLISADLYWATHILAFDRETIAAIETAFPVESTGRLSLFSSNGQDVGDPYGQAEGIFQDCFDEIESRVKVILSEGASVSRK